MKYRIHDGSVYIDTYEAPMQDVMNLVSKARETAVEAVRGHSDHAVYAVRNYNTLDGSLSLVDIYIPAIPMTEEEFDKRIPLQYEASPGCIIEAMHKF